MRVSPSLTRRTIFLKTINIYLYDEEYYTTTTATKLSCINHMGTVDTDIVLTFSKVFSQVFVPINSNVGGIFY